MAVVGDRLEDIGHPAAAWWRDYGAGWRRVDGQWGREPGWSMLLPWLMTTSVHIAPGAADLCCRLDRVTCTEDTACA